RNLVRHGSLRVAHDRYGLNSPWSSYGIGMSLVMAPLYVVGRAVAGDGVGGAMFANAVLFAGMAVALVVYCRLDGLGWAASSAAAGAVALGTPLLSHVATGFSEVGVALGVAWGLVGVAAAARGD